MLFWLIVLIGALGLLKTWNIYSDAKFERERKLKRIQRKLNEKEKE